MKTKQQVVRCIFVIILLDLFLSDDFNFDDDFFFISVTTTSTKRKLSVTPTRKIIWTGVVRLQYQLSFSFMHLMQLVEKPYRRLCSL